MNVLKDNKLKTIYERHMGIYYMRDKMKQVYHRDTTGCDSYFNGDGGKISNLQILKIFERNL